MRIDKELKLMARKRSRVALHHKGLEPKNVPRQRGQISLGCYTNTKDKPRYNFQQGWYPRGKTTNVGNKESSFVVLKQIKDCAADGMLECDFGLPRQIMFVPRMVYM